ncbi:hypothetical protein [Paenibacillus cymbidii]|uniref:hypothetical protein n=1 Tax=Paenibacillus cymbidii TaxID=1639034 RepID=UPI001081E503|nr:hypothetical protein [Paenibacillus cymbidii]
MSAFLVPIHYQQNKADFSLTDLHAAGAAPQWSEMYFQGSGVSAYSGQNKADFSLTAAFRHAAGEVRLISTLQQRFGMQRAK